MEAERWRKVESIFHAALQAGEDRCDAVLAESCAGDESLRREVESLLAHHQKASGFMETPAFAAAAPAQKAAPVPSPSPALTPLSAGNVMGQYRIVEEIGGGGMGVVYKAEDTKLGRLAALKFLPEDLATDVTALERFQREARAASALNHPNICTIYDIEEYGKRQFIAMEYLDGRTLKDQILARALEVEEVARLGIQIAEALSAAHSKGVVHRDIKPGNIIVTTSGLAKVLDFGLAKVIAPEGAMGPTQSLTATHTVSGTLPYMSPEQLRRREVDLRTDIYALGVVLYEMSTGRRPFAADSMPQLIDDILNQAPASPQQLNGRVPLKLEEIILKCLEKNPEDRYQSAKEIAVDLRRMSASSAASAPLPASREHATSGSAVMVAARRHKWGLLAGGFVGLLLLAAAGIGVYSVFHRPVPMPFENFTVTQVTNSGKAARAAISPDGRYVLSVMDDNGLESLWLRNVPSGSDTQVIPPSASHYETVTFSPDGNYIYFLKSRSATQHLQDLYRAPVLGGTPQVIVRDIDTNIDFSPDGSRMAYVRTNDPEFGKYRLLTSTLTGGDEKILRIAPVDDLPHTLAWAPEGKEIVYTTYRPYNENAGLKVFDFKTGRVHSLAGWGDKYALELKWLPDGRGILVSYSAKGPNFNRGQIGFLPRKGGKFQPITRDINGYDWLTLSADGKTLATVQTKTRRTLYLLFGTAAYSLAAPPLASRVQDVRWFNWSADGNLLVTDGARLWRMAPGEKSPTQVVADPNANILWAAECGSRYLVLVWQFHEGTSQELWRLDSDGTNAVRLTKDRLAVYPLCSPDQKWVYYLDPSTVQLTRVAVDGSGKPEPVPAAANFHGFPVGNRFGISADGRTLALAYFDPQTQEGQGKEAIALFDLDSAAPPRVASINPHVSGGVQFALDDKTIAYPIRENGVDNLWIQALDGSGGHKITNLTSDQIETFSWSPDGKALGVLRGHAESDVILLQEVKP